jgi:uncharacterized membrane protein
MKSNSILLSTAIGTLLAFGAAGVQAGAHEGAGAAKEKCYGVAKAGENGCAANGHSCQGQSKVDNDPSEWKNVGKGECEKMGGSLTAGKKAS